MPELPRFNAWGRAAGFKDPHFGLLLARHGPIWTEGPAPEPAQGAWMKLAQAFVVPRLRLDAVHGRLDEVVRVRQGVARAVTTASPLATGLGNPHPLENGFTVDHHTGAPVLAGSGLKGVTRAFARMLGPRQEVRWARFLGSQSHAGDVVFLDAHPLTAGLRLVQDLVNPHESSHYRALESGGEAPDPLGTDNPIPSVFLAIAPGATFRIRLLPRAGASVSTSELERVLDLLHTALAFIGFGAKTAAGYGRFLPPDPLPELTVTEPKGPLRVFLSHHSADKAVVEPLAVELGRLGVVPGLNDLPPGGRLTEGLRDAIRRADLVVFVLSPTSASSPWVDLEQEVALEGQARIVPWFLGDHEALVRGHRRLLEWLSGHGGLVDKVGVTTRDPAQAARELVGATLAQRPFRALIVDQGGAGERTGESVPTAEWASAEEGVRIFRWDRGPRKDQDPLLGADYSAWVEGVRWSLGRGRPTSGTVTVGGAGSPGMAWALGRLLNRNTQLRLVGRGRDKSTLTGPPYTHGPLPGGNPDRLQVEGEGALVWVYLGNPLYFGQFRGWLGSRAEAGRVARLEYVVDESNVEELLKDLVAGLAALVADGVTDARFATSGPFHFIPLVAAALQNVFPASKMVFVEYRALEGTYEELPPVL